MNYHTEDNRMDKNILMCNVLHMVKGEEERICLKLECVFIYLERV